MEHELFLGLSMYGALVFGYFSLVIPFTVLDYIRPKWALKYRIQKDRWPTKEMWALSVKMVARNFLILFPLTLLAGFVLEKVMPPYFDPVGDWSLFLFAKLPASFVIDDFFFYWYHRTLHAYPGLYKSIHKPHHVFVVPFAFASIASHPMEMMLQSAGGMCGPLIFQFHIKQFWIWLVLRQWAGIEDHVGYDFPFSPTKWFFAGAAFHDDHHSKITGNYASAFSFYDDLFGTRISKSE